MKTLSACLFVALFAYLLELNQAQNYIVPPVVNPATNYQKWAHFHWVWLKNSLGNQENETSLIKNYEKYNIPVGALNIDSEWATAFNNFVVDVNKFPDFEGMINDMHDDDIKVILWATSMVNVDNPDYEMCVENDYLIRNSKGYVRPISWWHGDGGLLDYSNPNAVDWWHKQMDLVLDAGVDGFKCDGTDPYILEYELTGGALGYNDQKISYQDYAYMYYRDFLYYTREKRSFSNTTGDAGLIMSRPVDCLLDQVSKVCQPFSPKDVMFSGWVGDDDATFNGLRGCARKVIFSAWMGYGNFACDVGGYRGNDETKDHVQFLRSAQFNSFLPLMENGGGGEHRPWMYTENPEVISIYRTFVEQHTRLSAYLLTNGANSVDSNTSAIHPVDYRTIPEIMAESEKIAQHVPPLITVPLVDPNQEYPEKMSSAIRDVEDTNLKIVFPQPSTYAYLLGQDILVHPVMYDAVDDKDTAEVEVNFPELCTVIPNNTAVPSTVEGSTVWLDWWSPSDPEKAFKAGESTRVVVPLDSYPVYVRKNAFIPLHPWVFTTSTDSPVTSTVLTNEVHFTWFAPTVPSVLNFPDVEFDLRESVTDGSGMTAKAGFISTDTIVVEVSAHDPVSDISTGFGSKSLIKGGGVSLVGVSEPNGEVTVEAWSGSECTYDYAKHSSTFTVSCGSLSGGLKVTVKGIKVLV